MPESCKEATVALIPKMEHELNLIKNYRLILLLNNGYKIFKMILANRLKILLQEYIHPEQGGFLPKRPLIGNIRVVCNIIEQLEQQ